FVEEAGGRAKGSGLVRGEKRVRYEELEEWSNGMGGGLGKRGVKGERGVGMMMDGSLSMIGWILGVWKGGGC
ncbi:hypothetical protein, partial [Bacillus subtilis]|uniref:hypothetical protein n=1 Tax=Bacillus subtilis TaxID=1423 RepID=UPI001BDBAB2E